MNFFYVEAQELNELNKQTEANKLFINLQNLTYLSHEEKSEYQRCNIISCIPGYGVCKLIKNNNTKCNSCLISVM